MSEGRAVVMVLLAAVMWGTTGTARALSGGPTLGVGAVRIALGGGTLLALALARGTLTRTRWPLAPSLIAACGVAAYQLTFFEGVARAGVAAGTILAIGSAPLFTGLIAWLVLHERPSARWVLATTLAIVGVALLSLPGSAREVSARPLVLPLAAGASYAVYATATKMLVASHDSVAVAAVAFGGGAVLLLPVLALSDLAWLARPVGAIAALELGLVATALAYLLFTRGLTHVPVSWGATLSLAEPLTASVLGVLLLGESLAAAQLAGAALIALGLLSLATARS